VKTAFPNMLKRQQILIPLVLVITAIVFLLLNFCTPLISDDFAYLYKFGPKALLRPTNIPVKNIGDVFESQYYHYLDVNGRFFSHFLIQLFLLFGKFYFNLFNTFIFIGLIVLIFKYSKNDLRASNQKNLLIFILFSVWFCTPFFGQTMLAVTGTINYLWGSCFVVLFLFLYNREEQNNKSSSWLKLMAYFIFSFCISSSNESVTFGLAMTLLFIFIFSFRKLKPILWVMIIGFGLGVLAIIFSPATTVRAHKDIIPFTSVATLLHTKLLEGIAILYFLRFSLTASFVLLSYLKIKKVFLFKFFLKEKLVIISIVFNCVFLLIIGNPDERMLFGTAIFMALFNSVLFTECLKMLPKFTIKSIAVIISLFLCFSFLNAIQHVNDYREKNITFENELKNKRQTVFYFPDFQDSRFVYNTLSGLSDSKDYHNRVRGFYYGMAEVNIIPLNLYHEIFSNSLLENQNNWSEKWQNKIIWLKNEKLIIIKLPTNFNYNESLLVNTLFIDGKEQKISVPVIPIKGNYYVFLNTSDEDFNAALLISVVTKNGKIIKKLTKSDQ
jgi:hypothetical protein